MKIDVETVESCRERDGEAAQDRSDAVEDAVNTNTVGHGKGEPLVADSYSDYPSRAELSNPINGSFVRELLAHPQVDGLDTAVEEITGGRDSGLLSDWLRILKAATEVHGLDVDTLTSKGEQGLDVDTLHAVLGYNPHEGMVHRDNAVLMAELYASGLSVVEVADVLSEEIEGSVSEGGVRDSLKDVGLLDGSTREEDRENFEDKGSKLGGTTLDHSESTDTSPDLTINASDY